MTLDWMGVCAKQINRLGLWCMDLDVRDLVYVKAEPRIAVIASAGTPPEEANYHQVW